MAVAEPFFALSGYDNQGRRAVPSLLRSLLSEHLDPGYAAAAQRGHEARQPRPLRWGWQLLGALLITVVFAGAVAQARSVAPGMNAAQRTLAANVRAAKHSADELTARRNTLAAAVSDSQRRQLRADSEGRRLLTGLDALALAAADTPVIGPGLTVTVTDPGVSRNLSDVSKQRVAGSRQIILDRDLQSVVNSLWSAGAEAIAVNDVRVGPNVTLRQAGGAILVDNTPISSPYTILAIGPPSMGKAFDRTAGLRWLRRLEVTYGVGVTVSAGDGLALPAGTMREVTYARNSTEPGGP
ncbi:DUF881 domain-containing protein [Mycolicibacillus parakoreensis]|nr:DUF881 domain-containing protein [Mycolicibacillus parakoreensis]